VVNNNNSNKTRFILTNFLVNNLEPCKSLLS